MNYFDNAATTYPKPKEVYEFMNDFYKNYGGSYARGNYGLENSTTRIVSDTRAKLKKLLKAENKSVVFTPTATIALNIIIQGLIKKNREKKNIYISPFEHNAVVRILEYYKNQGEIELNILKVENDYTYNLERLKYQFDKKKPDILIISHASNVTGIILPVEEIAILAKEYSSFTVLDMSQTAGLIEINLNLEAIDFAVFAGHKTLYAPTGISGFLTKENIKLETILFGGTGYDSANLEMPSSVPERYEMGTLNIQAIAGLNAALKWIEEIKIINLYKKELHNRNKLKNILKKYNFIKIVGDNDEANYVGIISFIVENISSESLAPVFSHKNIIVRTGLHCAPLAHKFLGTFPAGTIRLSTSYFTNDEDFENLTRLLDYIEENI
ncbi:cysteine desulfurase [Fusobacterium nucleatum subsp. nucleatum ATCC 25586]|uniref:Cysteine desulfurase n=1 Tax=Fusobacterium nucleatum subsp. nucleatum (strain ATCC 25586 / DSM 15643 / BCRC 10681 / CIP 101130 / JCM 8532 / KCTC 2640 / LMG 13131 / VPI 4355) TaxID=190304 RepID=Q8RG70_FUSNN|nr:aminotransferase class V-fold PLP-dependent enzyme [Fusobacterium nucleatum]AAL94643.1 NIFS protein [Fusobacterium nucleatum subsp. nucleatum ATCC 25586]AVQ14903.1 cysteine desulfurase [Fusobacterium nucleatum subsp. nucleatum ATCC 25586]WMS29757.1 aminotransferase class V-fold PLP-dependent enzyme [Fusobacterium nucleatum]